VQSALFDRYKRRVVVPLARQACVDNVAAPRFNPTFTIEDTPVVLQPLNVVSVATNTLGTAVHSLAAQGQHIIDALDELITRAYG
jgi:toxin CcdB